MSLIIDALKTSQRERQRRESGGGPPPPLLVPLRSKPKPEFGWRRSLTMGVSVAVIVGSAWVLYVRLAGPPSRPARTVVSPAAVAAAPLTTQAGDTARTVEAPSEPRTAPTQQSVGARSDSTRRVALAAKPVTRVTPTARLDPAAVVPPIRQPAESAATSREPAQGGRLRISVEQPRGYEGARLFALGVAAHRAGDLDAARTAYERVLLLAPNDVDALNNLGVLLGAQRAYERADLVLRRAVRLAPRNAAAWSNLGTVLAQRGHAGEAIAAFQQALQIDPMSSAARVSLAQQHLAIGTLGRARELLEEALAANPSLAEAHYTLGQAYEAQKDWAGAIKAYNAFIRVAPPRLAPDVELVRKRVEILGARVK